MLPERRRLRTRHLLRLCREKADDYAEQDAARVVALTDRIQALANRDALVVVDADGFLKARHRLDGRRARLNRQEVVDAVERAVDPVDHEAPS